jgi:hypothetical protein
MPGDCPAFLAATGGLSVENVPFQTERGSGRRQKLFGFPPESMFTFKTE